ncbi:hypothetical protein QOZ80_9AG0685340 [Eleusine coracana subsp. coracana]|nr:hypothetical protein QOZ80_9AG0685340 [Eleusine coracana subsp. coracana]
MDKRNKPEKLPFHLLEDMTNGFSKEQKVGSGGYGEVYKGVRKNGEEIAIKKLYEMPGLNDDNFQNELENLVSLKHPNIVQFVGYCYEIRHEYIEHKGKLVLAQQIDRALCFEYLPNGSLQKHLDDEYNGLDWHTRYKIIKGTCKDFGLSRIFGEEQTCIVNTSMGTIGYLPPEYIQRHVISKKFDIFSLGVVIIKIMAGSTGYTKISEMASEEFIDVVHGNWKNRLQAESMHLSELYDDCVTFELEPNHPERYLDGECLWGSIPPRSTYTLIVTAKEQQEPPQEIDKFVIKSIIQSNDSKKFHEVTLMSAYDPPGKAASKIISDQGNYEIVDVHEKDNWILTNLQEAYVGIFNYETQEIVNSFEVVDTTHDERYGSGCVVLTCRFIALL